MKFSLKKNNFNLSNQKNVDNKNFEQNIKPFFWSERDSSASVCLDVETYKNEGFEGNGYDWTSLTKVFLEEKHPELTGKIAFDSESSMYCVYSSDKEAVKSFNLAFKKACKNETLINDLFSRAELD